jgi:hypothetical protein
MCVRRSRDRYVQFAGGYRSMLAPVEGRRGTLPRSGDGRFRSAAAAAATSRPRLMALWKFGPALAAAAGVLADLADHRSHGSVRRSRPAINKNSAPEWSAAIRVRML